MEQSLPHVGWMDVRSQRFFGLKTRVPVGFNHTQETHRHAYLFCINIHIVIYIYPHDRNPVVIESTTIWLFSHCTISYLHVCLYLHITHTHIICIYIYICVCVWMDVYLVNTHKYVVKPMSTRQSHCFSHRSCHCSRIGSTRVPDTW